MGWLLVAYRKQFARGSIPPFLLYIPIVGSSVRETSPRRLWTILTPQREGIVRSHQVFRVKPWKPLQIIVNPVFPLATVKRLAVLPFI